MEIRGFFPFANVAIDQSAFDSIKNYIDYAKKSSSAEIITGGNYDDKEGYFIEPTTIITSDPNFKTMCEEAIWISLTIYIYEPNEWSKVLKLIDSTSEYALTGCVISEDKSAIIEAKDATHSAGNFYINDKPTGAVVGQRPFGGSRSRIQMIRQGQCSI